METKINNEKLWGENLFTVFQNYINEDGWLTSDWGKIINEEQPKWDKNFNDNPLHEQTYSRMYNRDFEENEDGTMIRPIYDPFKE